MLQKHIDKLDDIRVMLANVGSDIVVGYENVLVGLEKSDPSCFEELYKNFSKNSSIGKKIDNEILISLALFGAEATDLRELVAYLKVTNEMMRISDNITSFSKRIASLIENNDSYEATKEYSVHLTKSSLRAVSMVVEALKSNDKDTILTLYRNIQVEESKTDDLYSILEKSTLAELSKSNEFSIDHMNILSTMRKIERVADRAADISKLLVFASEGGELDVY